MNISYEYIQSDNTFEVSLDGATPSTDVATTIKNMMEHPALHKIEGILWDFKNFDQSTASDKRNWELILLSRDNPPPKNYKRGAYYGCSSSYQKNLEVVLEYGPDELEYRFFDDIEAARDWLRNG